MAQFDPDRWLLEKLSLVMPGKKARAEARRIKAETRRKMRPALRMVRNAAIKTHEVIANSLLEWEAQHG